MSRKGKVGLILRRQARRYPSDSRHKGLVGALADRDAVLAGQGGHQFQALQLLVCCGHGSPQGRRALSICRPMYIIGV
jgi:hypothetical protein